MPAAKTKPKRLKRGTFHRLPNGAGSIKIERNGTVLYKAPAKRKKNPARPKARKTAKAARRGARKGSAWVRAAKKR